MDISRICYGKPFYKQYSTKKNKKLWFVSFRYKNRNGEIIQKKISSCPTEKIARTKMYEFLQRYALQDNACSLLWSDFIDTYLNDNKNSFQENTKKRKQYTYKNHLYNAFKCPLNEVTPQMINSYNNKLLNSFKLNTVKGIYKEIKVIFNYAERVYDLHPNPIKKVKAPYKQEIKTEKQTWTVEQYNKVLEHVEDTESRIKLIVLFWSGLRKSEMHGLQWGDYDGKSITVRRTRDKHHGQFNVKPPKSEKSNRSIALCNCATNALDEWKSKNINTDKDTFIFTWYKSKFETHIRKACEQANVPYITVHEIRHSHASYLASNNISMKYISDRLGHTDITMTLEVYTHAQKSDTEKALDIMNKT